MITQQASTSGLYYLNKSVSILMRRLKRKRDSKEINLHGDHEPKPIPTDAQEHLQSGKVFPPKPIFDLAEVPYRVLILG